MGNDKNRERNRGARWGEMEEEGEEERVYKDKTSVKLRGILFVRNRNTFSSHRHRGLRI